MLRQFELFDGILEDLSPNKQLINTLNAHSFNTLKQDSAFRRALQASDNLLLWSGFTAWYENRSAC